ncbi:MAG TPA: acyloxyacyl hydrolase [Bacteroidia bacterium]|nr:acyloxyacyl hydrolase [Bacteroidia bacterium]
MRLIVLFLILNLYPAIAGAQYLDSLQDVIKGKSSIDVRLESRWSFIDHQAITISGVRAGAAYEKKLRLGVGLNWLKTNLSSEVSELSESGQITTHQHYFKLAYVVGYADAVFYKTKRWQLSVPIQIGLGSTWYQDTKGYSLKNTQGSKFLFIYEPGVTVQFKLTQWFGAGADVAYRFVLKNNARVSEQLNSPTYSLKILFWLDQLYYICFPESEWTRRSGPASW